MDRGWAKELLPIQEWLTRLAEHVERGRRRCLDDPILQEAGDSIMMQLCDAANRLPGSAIGLRATSTWRW